MNKKLAYYEYLKNNPVVRASIGDEETQRAYANTMIRAEKMEQLERELGITPEASKNQMPQEKGFFSKVGDFFKDNIIDPIANGAKAVGTFFKATKESIINWVNDRGFVTNDEYAENDARIKINIAKGKFLEAGSDDFYNTRDDLIREGREKSKDLGPLSKEEARDNFRDTMNKEYKGTGIDDKLYDMGREIFKKGYGEYERNQNDPLYRQQQEEKYKNNLELKKQGVKDIGSSTLFEFTGDRVIEADKQLEQTGKKARSGVNRFIQRIKENTKLHD